jgi:hypothetical protein
VNHQQIARSLRGVKNHLGEILKEESLGVIDEAIAFVESSFELHSRQRRQTHHPGINQTPWGFAIPKDRPVQFKQSGEIEGLKPQVDIHCDFRWLEEDDPPTKQTVAIRIWTEELNHAYREEWDSERVLEALTEVGAQPRVMLRFHFDKAEADQKGPEYHLQIGGNASPEELCWHPEELDLPRFAFPPMDFVLACQMIAANFFPDYYQTIRGYPEWTHIIRVSQEQFYRNYYEQCIGVLTEGKPLLDNLYNP